MNSLGLPIKKIQKCMGDPEADVDNEVLKYDQDSQAPFGIRVCLAYGTRQGICTLAWWRYKCYRSFWTNNIALECCSRSYPSCRPFAALQENKLSRLYVPWIAFYFLMSRLHFSHDVGCF